MTDKKNEELNEQELNQVTGGAADSHDAYANLEVNHLKSSLSKGKTARATKGLSKTNNDISAQNGDGSI